MSGSELLALVTFTIAGSGSPGPNNALLLTSGVNFGFYRTMPHVLGATVGVGLLVMTVAAGLGRLLETLPGAQTTLKVLGSIYLLFLAARSLSARTVKGASTARPLTAWEALLFQFVNPKAWLLAAGVGAAFLPPASSWLLAGIRVAVIFACVSSLCFAFWSAGGASLGRLATSARAVRAVNVILGSLLAASVALIWV